MDAAAQKRVSDFRQFVDAHSGWKLTQQQGWLVGTRTIKYPRGQKVVMWVKTDERARQIEGHVSVPLAAGPEESTFGSLKEVAEWMDCKERILLLPLAIGAAKTYQAAIEMASNLHSRELYTLSYVFNLYDSGGVPEQRLRQKLVEACAPKLAKTNKAGL